LALVLGNAFTFQLDSEELCDAFMTANVAHWSETKQVPSMVMCVQVLEI
jgi:hypothetical protein